MKKKIFLSFFGLCFFTLFAHAQTQVYDFNAFKSAYDAGGAQDISLGGNINFGAGLGTAPSPETLTVAGRGYWLSGNNVYSGFVLNSSLQSLSVDSVIIKDMKSLSSGGAVNLSASTATFSGKTLFLNNSAGMNGGAIYMTGSKADFNNQDGGIIFQNNVSISSGGAVYATNGSELNFNGNVSFLNNVSSQASAGVLYLSTNSVATFKGGNVTFQANKARTEIAAVLCRYNSTLVFEGANTRFIANSMLDNSVQGTGAIDITDGSTADFSKTVLTAQSNNAGSNAASFGGFLWSQDSNLIFGDVFIGGAEQSEGNRATNGGAIYSQDNSQASFSGTALFQNNVAYDTGGALYIDMSTYDFIQAKAVMFEGNYAADKGGAVYIENGTLLFATENGSVTFRNNKAGSAMNDIYLGANSYVQFNAANYGIRVEDGILSDPTATSIQVSKDGQEALYLGGRNEIWGQFSIVGGDVVLLDSATYRGNNLEQNSGTLDMQNNSVNTVNVGTFSSTVNTKINIFSNGTNDKVYAGNATVGGNLDIKPNLGKYDNEVYDLIVSSWSIINTVFASTSSGVSANMSYVLNYTSNPYIVKLIVNGIYSSTFSLLSPLTYNQKEVAKAWDKLSVSVSGELFNIISDTMLVDDDQKRQRLAQASGYFLANVIRSAAMDTDNNELYDKIKNHCLYERPNSGVWAQITGGNTSYGGDENSLGKFKDGQFGLMAGYDMYMPYHNRAVLGFFGKYDNHSINQEDNSADMTNVAFGVYGGLVEEKWEVKSFLSGSFDSYDTSRRIPFNNATAKGSFSGNTFGGDVEGALKINVVQDYIKLRPYLGLEVKNSVFSGFDESGAGALSLDAESGSYLRSAGRIGAGLGYDDKIFCWYVNAEAKYLLAGSKPEITAVFQDTNEKFNSRGFEEGKVIVGAGIGGSVMVHKGIKVFANTQYYGADQYQNIYGNIGVRYMFCKKKEEPAPAVEEEPVKPQEDAYEKMMSEARKRREEPVIKSFSLNMANFDTAKSDLKAKAIQDIKKVAEEIKQYKYNKITIEGHTDSVGSLEYNDILSRNRAKSVYEEFLKEGIPAEKMKFIGFGPLIPIASNETEEGRALNRRVEIFVE